MATDRAKRQMDTWERMGWTEKVIYRPANSLLRVREIVVLVDRHGNAPMMHGEVSRDQVTALNDDKLGIPSDPKLSDAGTDRIDVAQRVGAKERITRCIQRFVDAATDADFSVVEIQ